MAEIYVEGRLPRLLSPEQVAEILGISPRGVRRLAGRGELRGIRVGERRLRFTPEDVASYIESNREVVAA